MEKRSRLDEIEDYDYAAKLLVRKGLPESETRKLLEKRGAQNVEDLINEVKADFSGVKFIESGKIVRLTNYFIDLIAVVGIFIVLLIIVPAIAEMEALVQLLFIISVVILYYVPLEFTWGISLGKIITGTKVVNSNFDQPNLQTILIRTICRFLPHPWWIDRLFHDRFSNTFVVNAKRLKHVKAIPQ